MTQVGNVYAQGLYALAKDEALTKLILEQMQVLAREGTPLCFEFLEDSY